MHITIGTTTYRPETLEFLREAVRGHGVVLLEEPQTPGFGEMLVGDLAVEEYVQLSEFEFPEYARGQAELLRDLHGQGVVVEQVHPWLDALVGVQEFFAGGGEPGAVDPATDAGRVYATEKRWTGALLAFYEAAGKDDFGAITAAVRDFARMDAAKISQMDTWRANAVRERVRGEERNVYVECGAIHQPLVRELLAHKPAGASGVRVHHIMQEVVRERFGVRRLAVPGDVLTWLYALGAPSQPAREALLAARAIAYNRLVEKAELLPVVGEEPYPHLLNEAQVTALVNTLDVGECERLWREVRHMKPREAMTLVRGAVQ